MFRKLIVRSALSVLKTLNFTGIVQFKSSNDRFLRLVNVKSFKLKSDVLDF